MTDQNQLARVSVLSVFVQDIPGLDHNLPGLILNYRRNVPPLEDFKKSSEVDRAGSQGYTTMWFARYDTAYMQMSDPFGKIV